MANATSSVIAVNIWTARIIPVILAGIVGYATYVFVGPLTVDYLLTKHNDATAAIPILIIYFLLLIFMTISFFRLLYITFLQPPYVPLGPAAIRDRAKSPGKDNRKEKVTDGIGGGEYNSGTGFVDPDSPGLEQFYTKDIFVAEMDGKPKWCTHCGNWKPDRAHHCSSSGRCIKKMDHFCPWVGGPIGENNFKFFLQLTGYASLFCIHILVVMAIYIHQQRATPGETLNPQFVVILALSGFFGLFTAGMTATSVELAIRNQTQVERLGAETRVHILAVIKPPGNTALSATSSAFPCPEITYPLVAATPPLNGEQDFSGKPYLKTNPRTGQPDPLVGPEGSRVCPEPLSPLTSGDPEPHPLSPANAQYESAQHNFPRSSQLSSESTIAAASSTGGPLQEHQWPSKEIADRDLGASRTFVILKMPEAGYNPWDLGSSLLNWETVMGTTVLDWILPFRRSPCCSHEEDESYYQVGPMVDLLRSKYHLISEGEIREYGGRRRMERHEQPNFSDPHARPSRHGQREGEKKSRRRRHHSDKQEVTNADGQSTELTDLNVQK